MLMESHVDPFNAQEAKPYRSDPQIQAMTDLVEAYQNSDINKFERVLRASKATVLEDPFIRPYIEDLITVLRTQVCTLDVIPYLFTTLCKKHLSKRRCTVMCLP